MGWELIPEELKRLPQWVVTDATKKPMQIDGSMASVIDPATWSTFEEVTAAKPAHIGFVFTEADPYAFIDLDIPRNEVDKARRDKILESFPSYTEYSMSGKGYHIIVKGKVPEGARRDKVEIYSQARYAVMTGNVVKPLPIGNYQELLTILYTEIKRTSTSALPPDGEETCSDVDVVERAMRALNGDKFNTLCAGETADYPSQSEADMALLSILAFYTSNNEQVKRLFRYSALGKRDKAVKNDTYLDYAIKRIRANHPPPIDMGHVRKAAETLTTGLSSKPVAPTPPAKTFPPGLVGEIAAYFLSNATRPVPEIALAGALAFFAGIVGRPYNISGTGLNLYILLLAKTGTGKEAAHAGIEALVSAIRPKVPMIDQFIGPASFASGQAITRHLERTPSFVSVLGEFGITLQQLSSPNANSATLMLKRVLLDLYSKSGAHSVLRPSVYSDTEKNTSLIHSPAVTLLGESTPEAFFDGISAAHIAEGLMPRFLTIEYLGDRPPRNPTAHRAPPEDLTNVLVQLITQVLTMQANQAFQDIEIAPTATAILNDLDIECDRKINSEHTEIEAHLWNRAHLKALKLAGLLAVGAASSAPVIQAEHARWAVQLVKKEISAITSRFREGDIGVGDSKQLHTLRKAVEDYYANGVEYALKYGASKALYAHKFVPYAYLQRRCVSATAFRSDRSGATLAIKRNLQALVDAGFLVEIPRAVAYEKAGFQGVCFAFWSKG